MRRIVWLSIGVMALAGILLADESDEWNSLFNGQDLTGWKVPDPNPWWRVENGVIVGENDDKLRGSILWTEKTYSDFEVEADVRFHGNIDSGIFVRQPKLQVQIGISRSLKRDMTCSIYIGKYPQAGQAKRASELLKPDDWNTVRIRCLGPRFTIWLNGEQVVDYENAKYSGAAPIGLQLHPRVKMKVEFRNLRVHELEQ